VYSYPISYTKAKTSNSNVNAVQYKITNAYKVKFHSLFNTRKPSYRNLDDRAMRPIYVP